MRRLIPESVVRYVTAPVLFGARWLLLKVDGSAASTPAAAHQIPATQRPPTTRPLIDLGQGVYAEWCPCGTPPMGNFVVVETRSGRLIAMHFECLHGR